MLTPTFCHNTVLKDLDHMDIPQDSPLVHCTDYMLICYHQKEADVLVRHICFRG